jgi:hypothetical protein
MDYFLLHLKEEELPSQYDPREEEILTFPPPPSLPPSRPPSLAARMAACGAGQKKRWTTSSFT